MQTRSDIWQKLLMIDRRILYLLLFVNIVVFLLAPVTMPTPVSPPVQSFYNTIEKLQPGDMVMISSNWSASTFAENQPQLEAVLRHLIRKGVRFSIMSNEPQARDISFRLAEQVTKQENYEYGKRWVHIGFLPDLQVAIKGMVTDFYNTVKEDIRGTPARELPVFEGVRSLRDYKLVIDVTPAGTVPTWIAFAPKEVSIIYCPTSVMAAEAYTYLDSGQLKGMLGGARGAREYEYLLGYSGLATRLMNAVSFSHVLIIVFILLGNFAMLMRRLGGG